MNNAACAMNGKFFALSLLLWDSDCGNLSVSCYFGLVHDHKCNQTMVV